MRKISMMVALVLACVMLIGSCFAEQSVPTGVEDGVLTISMECGYAPYNWIQNDDSNGGVPVANVPGKYANGYDVMIAKKICEANGWQLEIIQSDWDSLVPAVMTGTIDAAIAGQSMTAERMEQVDFAGPYYYASIVCVTKQNSCFAEAFICTDMPTAMGACAVYPDMKILDFTGSEDNFQVADDEINIGISVMKGNTYLKDAINSVLSTMTADDFNALMDEAISYQPMGE